MKSRSKIAILTFVYEAVKPYFHDFLSSINNQSRKDFDLIIVNDGFEGIDSFLEIFPNLNFHVEDCRLTPSKNREYGINLIKNLGYEYCIMADSDDTFSVNRVNNSILYLQNYPIVVNDLAITDSKGNVVINGYFCNRLKHEALISFDFLRNKNLLGFSNTAFRTKIVCDNLIIPNDLKIVDWYFYTYLLKKGYNAIFDGKSYTLYRQSDNNIIGINNLSENNYRDHYKLKSEHYYYISQIVPELSKEEAEYADNEDCYRNKLIVFNKNKNYKYPFWWEEV